MGFSRAVESARGRGKKYPVFPPSPPYRRTCRLYGRPKGVNEKRQLPLHLRHHPIKSQPVSLPIVANERSRFRTDFSCVLGTTNLWLIADTFEPFSTSVFQVFFRPFAPTIKICTGAYFTPPRDRRRATSPAPPYSLGKRDLPNELV